MLAVTRLDLAGFRSHAAVALDLDPRPVAVFGPNGAGKTNLLEALSLLSPGRGLRGAAGEDLAARGGSGGWRVTAHVHAPDGAHEILCRGAEGGRSTVLDGKAAPQLALSRVLRVLWLTPGMDRLWVEGAGERRRFLDRVTLSLAPSHADAAVAYDRALRERNRLLRDGVRDAAWLGALEARMAESGGAVIANRRTALARLAAVPAPPGFPAADLALERDGPDDPPGLAAALAAARPRDFAAGRSGTGPHRDDLAAVLPEKGIAARLCSTGEQKAMLVSLVLANAAAVAADYGAPPLLLLDEVAAHLDAGRRAALFDAILALGAQAWMTGTEAEVFAPLGARVQRLAVSVVAGHSRVGPG